MRIQIEEPGEKEEGAIQTSRLVEVIMYTFHHGFNDANCLFQKLTMDRRIQSRSDESKKLSMNYRTMPTFKAISPRKFSMTSPEKMLPWHTLVLRCLDRVLKTSVINWWPILAFSIVGGCNFQSSYLKEHKIEMVVGLEDTLDPCWNLALINILSWIS